MPEKKKRNPKSTVVPSDFNEGVSRRLRKAAFLRGFTTRELADEMHVSYNTVLSYMLGDRVPTLWRFKRICEALQVDPAWLLGMRDGNKQSRSGTGV
jgi:transcriptional regulator with XRE-family HTH domain